MTKGWARFEAREIEKYSAFISPNPGTSAPRICGEDEKSTKNFKGRKERRGTPHH